MGEVGGGDLRGLHVVVDGSQGLVVSSLGGSEGLHEFGPGLHDLHGVLHGEGGNHGQAEDLRESVRVGTGERERLTSLYMLLVEREEYQREFLSLLTVSGRGEAL